MSVRDRLSRDEYQQFVEQERKAEEQAKLASEAPIRAAIAELENVDRENYQLQQQQGQQTTARR